MSRMTAAEVIAEIDWFLEVGEHPAMICAVLGRFPASLERLCRRYGRDDLAAIFGKEAKYRERHQ